MAIGTPVDLGTANTVTSSSSVVLTTEDAAPSGCSIIVGVMVNGTQTITSVTDSVGNTYVSDVDRLASRRVAIWSCHNATALPLGGTITVTISSLLSSSKLLTALAVTGLEATSTKDKTSSNDGNSTTWSTGSTGTLSQADEFAMAVAASGAATANTPDGGWTEHEDLLFASNRRWSAQSQIVSATTALNAGGTWGNAIWNAAIATYKGASSGTSDSAVMGVASAAGIAPNPKASASPGAAATSGTSPGASASAPAGQAAGAGIAPTASATATAGQAAAAGIPPAASTRVYPGTATAAGVAPSASVVDSADPGTAAGVGIAPTTTASDTPTPGIATVQGISPTDSALDTTPTPGVASARGVSPTARVTVGLGAATAAGVEPGAVAGPAGVGAAAASGIEPTASTASTPVPATATATGIEPAAVALAGVGVATTTGVTPGELFIRPSPGRIALSDEPRDRVTTTTQETAAGIHLSDALRDRISLS